MRYKINLIHYKLQKWPRWRILQLCLIYYVHTERNCTVRDIPVVHSANLQEWKMYGVEWINVEHWKNPNLTCERNCCAETIPRATLLTTFILHRRPRRRTCVSSQAKPESNFWITALLCLQRRLFIILSMQPLPDLRKGCVTRNFTHVEFYVSRNFPKFKLIFFTSQSRKVTKVCFATHNKRLRQVPVQKRIL